MFDGSEAEALVPGDELGGGFGGAEGDFFRAEFPGAGRGCGEQRAADATVLPLLADGELTETENTGAAVVGAGGFGVGTETVMVPTIWPFSSATRAWPVAKRCRVCCSFWYEAKKRSPASASG